MKINLRFGAVVDVEEEEEDVDKSDTGALGVLAVATPLVCKASVSILSKWAFKLSSKMLLLVLKEVEAGDCSDNSRVGFVTGSKLMMLSVKVPASVSFFIFCV